MFYNTIYMNIFYLCRLLFLANIGYFWWPWMCFCLSVSRLALNMFILCCAMSRLAQSSLSLSSLVTHTHRELYFPWKRNSRVMEMLHHIPTGLLIADRTAIKGLVRCLQEVLITMIIFLSSVNKISWKYQSSFLI